MKESIEGPIAESKTNLEELSNKVKDNEQTSLKNVYDLNEFKETLQT